MKKQTNKISLKKKGEIDDEFVEKIKRSLEDIKHGRIRRVA